MAFNAIRRALGSLGDHASGNVPGSSQEIPSGDAASVNPHFAEMYRSIDAAFTGPKTADAPASFLAARAERDAGWTAETDTSRDEEREIMSAAPYRAVVTSLRQNVKPDSAALFGAARDAMRQSHSPYSQFPVGAAILAEDGKVYSGCNVENASFPEGWCAETSAIAHMVRAGGRRIVEIAVVAEKMPGITPCGGCRQRILEFGSASTLIHLCDADGVVESVTLADILPRVF